MKIRSKLFLSLVVIAGVSTLLATFFAIYSVSENYEEIAREETVNSRKNAENVFYEYLGDLTRKAVFISELNEVIENMEDPNELFISLEDKGFFLYNINTKIISPDMYIITSYVNSSESIFTQGDLKQLPFFQEERDPLIRDTGIFSFKDRICILTVSPIVNQTNFDFKGFVFFELYLNSEFADQLKDKAGCEIIIVSKEKKLATSFQDDEGRRFFPIFTSDFVKKNKKLEIFKENYLIDGFTIFDYFGKNIGTIFVAVNVKNIVVAKAQGIRNILIVLFIVTLLVVGISLVVGRKLIQPLLVLSQSAEAISKGQFDVQIKPTSKDEIGDLSTVFSNMAESLKAQREEILDLKIFFEKVINNSPSALIICDETGGVISINPAAEKIFKTDFKNIEGRDVFETFQFPPSIKADFYKVIFSGNPSYHDSYPLFLPSKEEKIFRLTLYKIILKKGISVAMQIEDITERLQMEEELTHAQKMGTLGEVLSRFTHEFNNLMTGIIGHISLLKLKTEKSSANFSRIILIEELTTKAHDLGKNILSFSRKEKYETEKINIIELIDSVLNLIGKTVLKDVVLEKKYSEDSFFIIGNKERLSLAFFNLFINAKDAISEATSREGRISIMVDYQDHKNTEKRYVKVRISDNGIGVDEKNIDKIFLPYFSTKGRKGTGIGLSTVKQVINNCDGEISVSSHFGVSTTFTILIPEAR
ncbi:MAG: HAMP domain-containing protein [Candidatus Aminicenantes bacterium]|nr:HAMP domain-containing protein [Candidatus Aminicenantes bacterium]